MKKLLFFWHELKSTFWFIPVLIILASILLALALGYADSHLEVPKNGIGRYVFVGSVESARVVLSTVSAAMIGVAGTVFSITLVALTLASSQFGPRLIKNFMYIRVNQVVLGSYVSTYVYCLLVLNTIKGNEEYTFIPYISILFALVIAVVNILLLIVFIHRTAVSIQADKVIADISHSLGKSVRVLFPEKMGTEADTEEEVEVQASDVEESYRESTPILSPDSGYLQYIDSQSLIDLADRLSVLVKIRFKPGDYLVADESLCVVYSNEKLKKEDIDLFQSQFIIGSVRTSQQDAEYAIHQMVEIAAKALSPGVNDPYTAIACIDNLTATLTYLSGIKFPSRYRYGESGNLRVVAEVLTFEGMLDAAFNQIRQYAKGNPSVVIRLMESLITIDKFAGKRAHKTVIKKHARMVLNMARRSFEEENDLKDLEERSKVLV